MHPLLPQVSSLALPYLSIPFFVPLAYAGSKPPQSLTSLYRAVWGCSASPDAYMAPHERLDFLIVTAIFGAFVGATTAFGVLSAEWLVSSVSSIYLHISTIPHSQQPMGYSDTTAGLMGASLLLSGIVASAIASPLLDRIFTYRLGVALKILAPIVAAGWFSLIWAGRFLFSTSIPF